MISILTPVYKADTLLPELVARVSAVMKQMQQAYEIILVEDHSPDDSWQKIRELCKSHPHVRGIKLSRNFGQH